MRSPLMICFYIAFGLLVAFDIGMFVHRHNQITECERRGGQAVQDISYGRSILCFKEGARI